MPSISFEGAKNFTISGGNFGDIAGGVVSYNFGNGFGITRTDAFTEYVNAAGPDTEPRFASRRRHMLAQRRSTGSPPPRNRIKSVPHRSDSAPSQALVRLDSPSHSESAPRAPTPPPTPNDRSFLSSPTTSTVDSLTGYSTPPSQHSDDVDVELTPLTEALGLNSRLTPNPQVLALSRVHEALVDAQEQVDVQLSIPEITGDSNAQPSMESPRVPNASHVREISNPPPPVPLRSVPGTGVNGSSTQYTASRDSHSRLGPPPPPPPRPMMSSVASRGTGALNVAQYRMQNCTESLLRTSSPEPMQLERRDPNPCLQRQDMPTRDNAGGHLDSGPSLSAQKSARNVRDAPSLTMPAQSNTLTVSQDGFGPVAGTPTLSTSSESSLTEEIPESQPHWTADSIGNWADDVEEGEDGIRERRGDFQPPVTFTDRHHDSYRDHHNYPSLHGTNFQRHGQCIGHPSHNSGFCGVSRHQGSLHYPNYPPYSFSGFAFNPSVPQRHPYGGGYVFVAPWAGVWQ